MRVKPKAPSPALVIACLALAIALGGTGYAAIVLAPKSVGTKHLKDKAVTPAKIGPPEKWHEVGAVGEPRFFYRGFPEMIGSALSNWGDPHNTAGFAKDQGGLVHLKGVIRFEGNYGVGCGSWTLFQLPRGYRPAKREALAGLNHSAALRIDVKPDGWVTLCAAETLFGPSAISLDGLTFRPVAAPAERTGPPTARFVTADFIYERRTIVLDAIESNDDGKIVKYEWDLDGNGSYETNAGRSIYQEWTPFEITPDCGSPVPATISLRVTDDTGKRHVASKAIEVRDDDC